MDCSDDSLLVVGEPFLDLNENALLVLLGLDLFRKEEGLRDGGDAASFACAAALASC